MKPRAFFSGSLNNGLGGRGTGKRAEFPAPDNASKPKAKSVEVLESYHRFCTINGGFVAATICAGRRYLHTQPVVERKVLTTTYRGSAARMRAKIEAALAKAG